jgi:acyl homoserine lactone synthase
MLIHLSSNTKRYNLDILNELYKVRSKIFIDRLDWDLQRTNCMEIDQFDHDECHHLVSMENEEVIGGVRLTPSEAPNLAFDLFSDILGLPSEIKRSPKLLESSRFGLLQNTDRASVKGIRQKTLELFEGMMKFGLDYGYENIITVTDIRIEKILKRAGWALERLTEVRQMDNTKALIGMLKISWPLYKDMHDKRIASENEGL